ncbi:MAG TPA: ribonuclease Y [Candidatus Binatia bacterium]
MSYLISSLLVVLLSAVFAFILDRVRRQQARQQAQNAEETARRVLGEARAEAETVRKESEIKAKEVILLARAEAEKESRERRRELQQIERRLTSREENLEKRAEQIEKREAEVTKFELAQRQKEKGLAEREEQCRAAIEETRQQLERVAGLTGEEAKRGLMDQMIDEARHEAAKRIRMVEEEARAEADRRAKKIVTIAIERLAGEFVAERTVSVVQLPNDDMKGRIIGREGRNIRAIEAATGVDLIIDDTPEAVILSCHNPIRREIARIALERLISDGRIHPGRVEEVVRKAEQEVEDSIREAGQKAIFEVGIHGVHPEIVKLLGMLKYRYSYAQNVLAHSIEAAFLCGAMAAELGLNEKQARRAALLHDIGKALTHEVEGSHAIIGADIARKYGESAKVVNAIAAHHEEVKAETILAPLVDAADALSGARPGARREMLESYVRRLEDLERISNSFKGVEKSFAVQAGREIRIIVEPRAINDDQASTLANEVARKIESEMTYPGQVKVTVIRETRASEYAR